jgi:hypothetical protein
MALTQRDINELRAIYARETGTQLSNDEAWAMGYRLLQVFDVLLRPLGTPGVTSLD